MNTTSPQRSRDPASPASGADPVCGMTVQAGEAAGRLEFGGKLYLFCSPHCLHAFEKEPRRYAAAASADGAAAAATVITKTNLPMQAALHKGPRRPGQDPICGMLVDKATALRSERGGRTTTSAAPAASARSNRRSRS